MMFDLRLEDELPVKEVPDIDAWSENFCFEGYDSERNIGFWIHMGRWRQDPRIWRERVQIYLPDGDFLVQRAWGATPAVNGVRGSSMEMTCVKPGETWRLRYRGPTRRATSAQLASAPLPEGLHTLLDFDLEFTGVGPIWDFGSSTRDELWCSQHYEAHGKVRGRFLYEGQEIRMDGVCFRDHSRGPRSLGGWAGHCWLHGQFDNDRMFALFHTRKMVDGQIVTGIEKAAIWDKGQLFDATCPDAPYLSSPFDPAESYRFTLESSLGSMAIEATTLRTLLMSTTGDVESFNGRVPRDLALYAVYQQPTAFRWNGVGGEGHSERTALL